MDLFEETSELLVELERQGVQYAIAGAVALAIHGVPRATTDIDLLVRPAAVPAVLEAARARGFDIEALPMRFSDGMEVRRVTKIQGDHTLTLDLLLVNEALEPVWNDRLRIDAGFATVWTVSREGLIRMKAAAGRDQDRADIQRLRELDR